MTLEIPAGVRSGRRLALRGYGDKGQAGGQDGDLFIELQVVPHPHFTRDGLDITCTLPIRLSEAVLGGEATVPLLQGGSVRLRIPAGSQSGNTLRLRGRGGKRSKDEIGDMYVELQVETPQISAEKARELIETLELHSNYPLRHAFDETLS
jgi:molecular chaperone DnaJ